MTHSHAVRENDRRGHIVLTRGRVCKHAGVKSVSGGGVCRWNCNHFLGELKKRNDSPGGLVIFSRAQSELLMRLTPDLYFRLHPNTKSEQIQIKLITSPPPPTFHISEVMTEHWVRRCTYPQVSVGQVGVVVSGVGAVDGLLAVDLDDAAVLDVPRVL